MFERSIRMHHLKWATFIFSWYHVLENCSHSGYLCHQYGCTILQYFELTASIPCIYLHLLILPFIRHCPFNQGCLLPVLCHFQISQNLSMTRKMFLKKFCSRCHYIVILRLRFIRLCRPQRGREGKCSHV